MAHSELPYFLLNVVFEHWFPIRLLTQDNLGEIVNSWVPPHSRDDLAAALDTLLQAGDAVARDPGGQLIVPRPGQLEAALDGTLRLSYGLTAQGGARWEALSRFDWDYHLAGWGDGVLEATNREMIETYLAWASSPRVAPGSERWTTIAPWQATYWKTLPAAVCLHYQELPGEPEPAYSPIENLWARYWNRQRHTGPGTYPERMPNIPPERFLSLVAWLADRREVRQSDVPAALAGVLRDGPSPHRCSAVTLLGLWQDQFAADLVLAALADPDDQVRANAVFAWGLRCDTRSPAEAMLRDRSGLVRYCAKAALEHCLKRGIS